MDEYLKKQQQLTTVTHNMDEHQRRDAKPKGPLDSRQYAQFYSHRNSPAGVVILIWKKQNITCQEGRER